MSPQREEMTEETDEPHEESYSVCNRRIKAVDLTSDGSYGNAPFSKTEKR
jgi:hypothetical protein